MYQELPYRLDGAVVWTRTDRASTQKTTHRILPDGCLDLIWIDGEIMVAGPDTRSYISLVQPEATCVAVRLRPGQGPEVLGLPAAELRDRRLALEEIWPTARARRLTERITAAADRPAVLAAEIAARLRQVGPLDPVTETVSAHLSAGHGVAATAEVVGLSPRQLHRLSMHAYGYGPKTLAKVLRMNRAVALARTGLGFADVATTSGYADQAHLARDVRQLAGVPLTTLLA